MRFSWLSVPFIAVLFAAAAAGSASAQEAGDTLSGGGTAQTSINPWVVRPDWTRTPSSGRVISAYPRKTRPAGVEGRTSMVCVIGPDGRFAHCDVDQEDPMDMGFAESALKLAPLFRMKLVDGDKQPVAGRKIRIPIRFVAP